MNIDLRNIDDDLVEIINRMKSEGKAQTATKCVELALRTFYYNISTIAVTRNELDTEKRKNFHMRNDIESFLESFEDLKKHVEKKKKICNG